MGITNHELDPSEARLFEGANEGLPEAFTFAITHLKAEQLTAAVGIDAHGDHSSSGADLQAPTKPSMEVGGVEGDVGVAALLQGPIQEGLHLDVDVGADAAHLGFGDAALDAQNGHQRIHRAGGDTADVGLHHHAIESLINAAAWLEDR